MYSDACELGQSLFFSPSNRVVAKIYLAKGIVGEALSLRHCTRNLSTRSLSGGVAAATTAAAMLVQTALLRCQREGGSRGSSRLD